MHHYFSPVASVPDEDVTFPHLCPPPKKTLMFDFDQRRHGQPKRAQKKSNHATLIYPDDSTEASS